MPVALTTTDVAHRRLLRYIPVAVLVVGIAGAAWGFARVQAFATAQLRLDLERHTHSTIRAVEKELAQYMRLMKPSPAPPWNSTTEFETATQTVAPPRQVRDLPTFRSSRSSRSRSVM